MQYGILKKLHMDNGMFYVMMRIAWLVIYVRT